MRLCLKKCRKKTLLLLIGIIFISFTNIAIASFKDKQIDYPFIFLEDKSFHQTKINQFEWSFNEQFIAVTYNNSNTHLSETECKIFSAITGKLLHDITAGGKVVSIAWSPNNKYLSLGLDTGNIEIRDTQKFEVVDTLKSSNDAGIKILKWHPAGRFLTSFAKDISEKRTDSMFRKYYKDKSKIDIFDMNTFELKGSFTTSHHILNSQWDCDGEHIVIAQISDTGVVITRNQLEIESLISYSITNQKIEIFKIDFENISKSNNIFTVPKKVFSIDQNEKQITSVLWSKDRTYLIIVYLYGRVSIYNIFTNEKYDFQDTTNQSIRGQISCSADGKYLGLADVDKINLFNLDTMQMDGAISIKDNNACVNVALEVHKIAWAPNSPLCAVSACTTNSGIVHSNTLVILNASSSFFSNKRLRACELTGKPIY